MKTIESDMNKTKLYSAGQDLTGMDEVMVQLGPQTRILYACRPDSQRSRLGKRIEPSPAYLTQGLLIDEDAELCYGNGQLLNLSVTEFRLLLALVRDPSRFVDRRRLLDVAESRYGHQLTDNTLSKHIHRLRNQLSDCHGYDHIVTKKSYGYKWCFPVYRYWFFRNAE